MGFPPDGSRFDGTIYPGVEIRFRVKYQKLLSGDTRILLIPVTEYNSIPEDVRCKDCHSRKIYRHGFTAGGVQRYKCRECGLTFIGTDTLKRMRVPIEAVGAAVGMYYEGLSLNAIRRQLDQIYDLYPSDSTVYEWVTRFTKVAIREAKQVGTVYTSEIWAADETVLKVAGGRTKEGADNTLWFWDVIDEKTRFLLGSHMSLTRTIRDAEILFRRAERIAIYPPRFIVTDKLGAYIDGIERVFGADTTHVQSKGMRSSTHNNTMERFHGTIKQRTKVMRGLQSKESAKLVMDGWLVHYNFIRPHEKSGWGDASEGCEGQSGV